MYKRQDGKERRVLNAKETTLAAQKQQAIREAFRAVSYTHLDVYKRQVQAMLERTYDVYGDDLAGQLTKVAGKLAEKYWTEHQQDCFYIVDGSFLEEYDEYNIGVQFKAAATVSITYALMSRCSAA